MRRLSCSGTRARPPVVRRGYAVWVAAVACLVLSAAATEAESQSRNRYRVSLEVDPGRIARSHSPTAPLRLDFQRLLIEQRGTGTFDEHTVEVIGHDPSGRPVVYDASRRAYEKHLLPHRIDKFYGISEVDLVLVMPDEKCTRYTVSFDTVESGHGKPDRYPGLVGDGDRFVEGRKRREINACHFDAFCDLDGDGDMDLFKAGVEPFVYCYENVGGNRFVDRGRLTSGGSLLTLPHYAGNGRSWLSVAFHDWDGDGDMDFFPSFGDGPDANRIVLYRNTTSEHDGQLTFTRVGPMETITGTPLGTVADAAGWFPAITFVEDWDGDGDGRTDVLVGSNNHCYLYRNLGPDGASGFRLADALVVQAGGEDIVLTTPRFDCADIDHDGDWDLFAGTQPGQIYLFENTDTTTPRTRPTFAEGRIIAHEKKIMIADAHAGVKVADFTGDGLLDFAVGRFWERVTLADPGGARDYGRLYENVGTATAPKFERRGASNGAPYTERSQICDAIRQNCVRAADWDKDDKIDLLAGDTDGYIWFFRNTTNKLFPVFATGEKLRLGNGELLTLVDSGGHARHDVCDWNNDGKRDLVVADGNGWVTWFENTGTDARPALAPGKRIEADGEPIDRGARSSVLVCDWNSDGKKDIIFADANDGYVFFENVGTDAAPKLAAPKPLKLDFYTRPNLGSFVDWDGDGKKDLIGCNFENNIRLYRNVGSGLAGDAPRLFPAEGIIIVKPFTVMLTSGAEVVDWNGDGDLDILTGQGHGASGLRFYERDYIEDSLRGTRPVAKIAGTGEK